MGLFAIVAVFCPPQKPLPVSPVKILRLKDLLWVSETWLGSLVGYATVISPGLVSSEKSGCDRARPGARFPRNQSI